EAIGGAEQVDVRLEGDEVAAEVIATDLTTDVAVLRIGAAATSPVSASEQTPLRVGETIALIGRTLRGPAAIWGTVRLA
ncbi:trypsin-like peptidase domain-containing protein, partial [Staphylococcus aureus]